MALPLREFCVDVVHSIPSREINSEKGINLTDLTSPLFTKKSKGIDICGDGRMVAPFYVVLRSMFALFWRTALRSPIPIAFSAPRFFCTPFVREAAKKGKKVLKIK